MVRIPAGDITNLHYNFVVAKPLVEIKFFEQPLTDIKKNIECLVKYLHAIKIKLNI